VAYELKTFSDLVTACREELSIQSGYSARVVKIKRALNEAYAEIWTFKRWEWISGQTQKIHKAYYTGGTAVVTPSSTTVTLSTAPGASYGSFANYYFAAEGFDEIYTISAHTAESTTVTLSSAYQGELNATSAFKIWTDRVELPNDCKEVVEALHNRHRQNMSGMGRQEFAQEVNRAPRAQGFPLFFHVGDFYDPTSGTDETDSDRYRLMQVHPAITDENVTLKIDYQKKFVPLSDDDDEPAMPIEHRSSIKYGALRILWRTLGQNDTQASICSAEFDRKLGRMSGAIEEGFDKPILAPNSRYIQSLRSRRIGSNARLYGQEGGSGGGGNSAPSYLSDVTINGATITGNVTVSSGITIDGVDISALSTSVTDHLADTEDSHDASSISVVPAGNLASDQVQEALEELQADVDTRALDSALTAHIADTTDAHDASAISVTPSGNLAADDVQEALVELQTDVDTRALASALTDHTGDTTDAHDASAISVTPAGNLAADDVQEALTELQTDVDTRATSAALTAHDADTTSVHGITDTADLLTTSNAKTVTNKTIDADSNTISNIDNADIKAAAGIARDKLASGSNNHVIINNGSGVMTSEAQLAVSRGGTGLASATAYAVVCGGTTSTNPLQSIAGVGTSGQVLTSNGAGALPTFQSTYAITDWTSVSLTGSLSTNVTYTAFKKQVGDTMYYRVKMAFSGTNTQGAVTVTLDDTIDTSKLSTAPGDHLGTAIYYDADGSGDSRIFGTVRYNGSTSVILNTFLVADTQTHYLRPTNTNANVPVTVANGDSLLLLFEFPIAS
jgi:hypothetical protein